MRESQYQAELIRKLRQLMPECFIIKLSTEFVQGLPDLLVLLGPRWGMLEVKANVDSPFRPNQEYYLEEFGTMSFASVIHPDNELEVIDELREALKS